MGLGIIFSGQGDQYPQMFNKLYKYNPDKVDSLSQHLGINLIPEIDLGITELYDNRYAQPLIASYEYLIWQELSLHLEAPIAFAGYSLGEVVAYACAANLDLLNTIKLAKTRASLMSIQNNGKLMAVSGLDKSKLAAICDRFQCYIAIYNNYDQYIIGGEALDIDLCRSYLKTLIPSPKLTLLNVTVAAHTPLLYESGIKFYDYLQQYKDLKLEAKCVSSTAAIHYDAISLLNDLAKQLYSPILFDSVIQVLYELGVTILLEIGPGRALSNIIKQYNLPLKVKAIDDFHNINGIVNWVNKYSF